MRLTLHTDYALRMLIFLALDQERGHTIEDVATCYDISRNHLMKVAQTLVQAGLIISTRGRNGGLRLASAPESVNLGAIVRATEDGFALVECFDARRNQCVISSVCGLRNPLQEALQAFLAVLDGYTLADLVNHPVAFKRMRRLLIHDPTAMTAVRAGGQKR